MEQAWATGALFICNKCSHGLGVKCLADYQLDFLPTVSPVKYVRGWKVCCMYEGDGDGQKSYLH